MSAPGKGPSLRGPLALLLAALAAAAAGAPRPAGAVAISAGTASGLAGQTVEVAIGTASVTGLGVYSYQFSLAYNSAVVTPVAINTAGTLSASPGWSPPAFNPGSGVLFVSDAGSQVLSGSGTLLKIQFAINPALLGGGSTALTFQSFLFNEGTPPATTSSGSITVNATPSITVSPNTAEMVRGDSVRFTTGGSVTPPVTWSSTDTSVADISSAGWLRGKKPGSVRVFAVDNAGIRDTTNGDILIRGMALTVGSATVVQGQPVSVPVTTTSLTGLGIRAGQFTITYNAALLAPTGMTAPPGTLLNYYGPTFYGTGSGTLTVDFTGNKDLSGAGTLCRLQFSTSPSASGSTALAFGTALFNETLPAKRTDGSVTVNAIGTITVSPDNVTLLAGQTQQFSVSGSPVPPITWSTLNPAVATIGPTGLLTAVAGGVTKVRAVDNVGASDENNSVTVYDFQVSLPTVTGTSGGTVLVPLTLDRPVGSFAGGIYSAQYTLTWNPAYVSHAATIAGGLMTQWGAPFEHLQSDRISVASAGPQPLAGTETRLSALHVRIAPGAPSGVDVPLAPTVLLNEGSPAVLVSPGVLRVRNIADVEDAGPLVFGLGPPRPNPVRGAMRLAFTLPETAPGGDPVRLALFGLDGRRLRTLVEEPLGPGAHEVTWDARDDAGHALPAGIYFCRLEWRGRHLERKLAVMR